MLTNPTDTDQSVTLVYPFSGSFYALYPPTLTADGAALDAVIRPRRGREPESGVLGGVRRPGGGERSGGGPRRDPRPGHAGDGLRLHRPHPAGERRCGPHPGGDLPLVGGRPRRADLRLSRRSIDREAGWARHSFSLPEPDSPHAQDPRLLIAVGGALEDYTLQGYRDGGCDPAGSWTGVSAAVTRYESTLREVLNALCPSPDTLAHKYGGETDAASLSREVFFDTLCRGLGTAVPADMTMLEDVFSWVNIQRRIFYTEAALTIPAGESVQVEAALPKEASFDFACAHTENRGIYGYDLVTRLGSTLSFTCQTAALAHTEQIAIVRQNFGFDLAAGLTSVPLAPDQEHYYLEVRRIK